MNEPIECMVCGDAIHIPQEKEPIPDEMCHQCANEAVAELGAALVDSEGRETRLKQEKAAIIRAIKDEPENPGKMPDRMWDTICTAGRAEVAELFRMGPRATKRNILKRIKERGLGDG